VNDAWRSVHVSTDHICVFCRFEDAKSSVAKELEEKFEEEKKKNFWDWGSVSGVQTVYSGLMTPLGLEVLLETIPNCFETWRSV
jgi:hypothetical protein